MRIAATTGLLATVLVTASHPGDALQAGVGHTPPPVHPNDNRTPAGRLRGDTLDLHLEVRMATWSPEADSGPAIEVAAFAEDLPLHAFRKRLSRKRRLAGHPRRV